MYPSDGDSAWQDVIYKGYDNYYLEATSTKGVPAVGVQHRLLNTNVDGTSALPAFTWAYLAATYDGATCGCTSTGSRLQSSPDGADRDLGESVAAWRRQYLLGSTSRARSTRSALQCGVDGGADPIRHEHAECHHSDCGAGRKNSPCVSGNDGRASSDADADTLRSHRLRRIFRLLLPSLLCRSFPSLLPNREEFRVASSLRRGLYVRSGQ